MATVDPNPPVTKDARANEPWSVEADGTPGSPDTTLVAGNLGQGDLAVDTTASNFGKEPTSNAEVNGANVETDGLYVSGYPLGTQEDDTTNPHSITANTNTGQKVYTYDGTTNSASKAATVVPGDTSQAAGESKANADLPYLANTPGAKQPDISDAGVDQQFGAQRGSSPNAPLDTLGNSGGAGTLAANYGSVAITSGTSLAQFGQPNNTSGELDTTNTSIATTGASNNGIPVAIPSSYVLTVPETLYGYPGLTVGVGETAPAVPTNVSWTFGPGKAFVSWVAPGTTIPAPVQSNAVGSATGGTLAAATYYYVITATNGFGETIRSNEKSYVATGSTSSVVLAWAAVTGATGYKVYRGTAAGVENKLIATIGSGATVTTTDTGAAGSTASPPSTNGTGSSTGGGNIREYLVYGYQVRDASKLPANDTAADLMKGQHTVSAHAHASVRVRPDGTTSTLELPTQIEIDHLTPGDFYFFRVQARNDIDTSALSTVVGISYPTAPATPYYYLSEQNLDASQRFIPGTSEPEGEALADLTFTGDTGIDELGNALSGQDAFQLAGEGEEEEDRI